jgi:hypothetical protein
MGRVSDVVQVDSLDRITHGYLLGDGRNEFPHFRQRRGKSRTDQTRRFGFGGREFP